MPYEWVKDLEKAPATAGAFSQADGDAVLARLQLWPNRSLSRRGFVAFLTITIVMFAIPLMALLGSAAMWVLLAFLGAALAAVWGAIEFSYATGRLSEVVTLRSDMIEIARQQPGHSRQSWSANPYWVRVQLHHRGGPVANYLTLSGAGREVELGAFLSAEERAELAEELTIALRQLPAVRTP